MVTLIDVCTRIVLGWQVVPAPEYNHHDVLAVLQDALRPRRKRDQLLIAGLAYRPTAGFATEVCPEVAYACWDVLKVDNAAAHLTEETFLPVCQFIGCRLEAGPVAQPTRDSRRELAHRSSRPHGPGRLHSVRRAADCRAGC